MNPPTQKFAFDLLAREATTLTDKLRTLNEWIEKDPNTAKSEGLHEQMTDASDRIQYVLWMAEALEFNRKDILEKVKENFNAAAFTEEETARWNEEHRDEALEARKLQRELMKKLLGA